ncbi:unnamed protein product [Cuscuta campestris]|uniref:Uncharacterized protein n=1 Tax=Cuscuta campestris TaxID=132261 RepID=A0A484LEF6_9ASTE|nr:unnamed protein product [Cuscuta campestris]
MHFTEEELESIVNSDRSICSILLHTVHHHLYCSRLRNRILIRKMWDKFEAREMSQIHVLNKDWIGR